MCVRGREIGALEVAAADIGDAPRMTWRRFLVDSPVDEVPSPGVLLVLYSSMVVSGWPGLKAKWSKEVDVACPKNNENERRTEPGYLSTAKPNAEPRRCLHAMRCTHRRFFLIQFPVELFKPCAGISLLFHGAELQLN